MWVTKLLISPVKKRIFCPKTTKFGPKLAFLVNLGQAMQAYSMPCCGSVGGCGARAVSRKTPIYFMYLIFWSVGGGKLFAFYHFRCVNSRQEDDMSQLLVLGKLGYG